MLRLLTRTSTYAICELFLKENQINSLEEIQDELRRKWNYNRKIHDIKTMITHLERIGIIKDLQFEPFGYKTNEICKIIFSLVNKEIKKEVILENLQYFLDYLSNSGLLTQPFLKAVNKYPNNLGLISTEIRKLSKEKGIYNLYVDCPSVSSMRNFFQLFKIMKKPNYRGHYELTEIGQLLIGEEEKISRARCSREFCREVCPANAIGNYTIEGCVGCGLCIAACPYGAITFDQNNPNKPIFNNEICNREKGRKKIASPRNFDFVIANEKIMQNWIKSVFRLTNLNTEIPGIGNYPDIVIEDIPTFIECKNKFKKSEKQVSHLVNQIINYTSEEIIQKTIRRMEFFDIKIQNPELFLVITPKGSNVKQIMKKLKEMTDLPISFLNTECISNINRFLTEGNYIEGKKILNQIEPFSDSSDLVNEILL